MRTTSVGIAFPGELARCQELLRQYKVIGPVGQFGHAHISAVMADAKTAWKSGDVLRILAAFKAMQGCA